MSVLDFAMKEIRLIKNSGPAFILTFLYPLVIVFSISFAFSTTSGTQSFLGASSLEESTLYYFIDGHSPSFDESAFLKQFSGSGSFKLEQVYSKQEIITSIKLRRSLIGMVITPNPQPSAPNTVDLYYDNSSIISSQLLLGLTRGSLNQYTYRESVTFIQDIFQRLETIRTSIQLQEAGLNDLQDQLDQSEREIRELQQKFAQIDFSGITGDLEHFENNHTAYQRDISDTRVEISESTDKMDDYYVELDEVRLDLVTISSQLSTHRNTIILARNQASEPLKSQMTVLLTNYDSQIAEIDRAITRVETAQRDIRDAQRKLTAADSKLLTVSQELDRAKNKVSDAKTTLAIMQNNLAETQALFSGALETKSDIDNQIVETRNQLTLFKQTLGEITEYDPDFLINPLVIRDKKLFLANPSFSDVEKLAVITPISIAIVLFLTTILLTTISTIQERKEGVAFRIMNAPVSKMSWVLGKILGQLFFAVLISLIILAITFFLFGVPLVGSVFDLAIVVFFIAFSFISLGLFITIFAKEYSTAILASLLVMTPMVFLSGAIFPTSFMPRLIAGIAEILPLTVANTLLSAVIVKGIPLGLLIPDMLVLLIPAFFFVGTTLYSKNI
jgi:ABC-type multidrug transport system permease subunit